jgi:chaperonin GroES
MTEISPKPAPLRPLADRVVLIPAELAKVSPGGILIPDTLSNSERPRRGTVYAVGPGIVDPLDHLVLPIVRPGDDVLYGAHSDPVSVQHGDGQFLFINEEDVLAILSPVRTLTNVLIVSPELREKSPGGLWLVDIWKKLRMESLTERGYCIGKVLVAGPKVTDVKVGDRIAYIETQYEVQPSAPFGVSDWPEYVHFIRSDEILCLYTDI